MERQGLDRPQVDEDVQWALAGGHDDAGCCERHGGAGGGCSRPLCCGHPAGSHHALLWLCFQGANPVNNAVLL